jgi:hypothetical protein
MKSVLGWVEPDQIATVSESGEQTLCPAESTDGMTKGLVIPLKTPIEIFSEAVGEPATFDRLLVEYRRALGFDRYVDRLQSSYLDRYKDDGPLRTDGVLVSLGYASTDTDSTMLLDVHPDSSFNPDTGTVVAGNIGKTSDALLLVGETFTMEDQGISITVRELTTDGGIVVDVTY